MTSQVPSQIPDFDLTNRVSAAMGKHDKMNMTVGAWHFDAAAYRDRSSIMNELVRTSYGSDHNGNQDLLFRPSVGRNHQVRFSKRQPAALFTGSSKRHNDRSTESRREYRYSLAFDVFFNPTIAIQSQPIRRSMRDGRLDYVYDIVSDFQNIPSSNIGDSEVILTPTANLIIGRPSRYRHAAPDIWNQRAAEIFRFCIGTVDSSLQDTVREYGTVVRDDYISIKEAEVYWEFWSSNAVDLVDRLKPKLMMLGTQQTLNQWDVEMVLPTQHTANSFSTGWQQNISIKFYAKTTNRVRLEITLKNDAVSSALSVGQERSSRVLRDFEGFEGALQALQQAAATPANEFLDALEALHRNPLPQRTLFQLFEGVYSRVPDPRDATIIISMLKANGCIMRDRSSHRLHEAINALEGTVLQRLRPRQPNFVVCPEYREPLEVLQQLDAVGLNIDQAGLPTNGE